MIRELDKLIELKHELDKFDELKEESDKLGVVQLIVHFDKLDATMDEFGKLDGLKDEFDTNTTHTSFCAFLRGSSYLLICMLK